MNEFQQWCATQTWTTSVRCDETVEQDGILLGGLDIQNRTRTWIGQPMPLICKPGLARCIMVPAQLVRGLG